MPGRRPAGFLAPRGVIFDISPSWIVSLAVARKHFILVHKPVMAISYHDPGRPAPEKACFLTPALGQWLVRLGALVSAGEATPDEEGMPLAAREQPGQAVTERPATMGREPETAEAAPELTHEDLQRLLAKVDPAGGEILSYLWLHGHADIGELAGLVGAATHMDVLFKIRQGINPLAEKVLGVRSWCFRSPTSIGTPGRWCPLAGGWPAGPLRRSRGRPLGWRLWMKGQRSTCWPSCRVSPRKPSASRPGAEG